MQPIGTRFWIVASILCLIPTLHAQQDRISGPIDASFTVVLDSKVAPLALAQRGDEGAVEPSRQLPWITLFFKRTTAQEEALTRLLAEQQDRSSPNYHQWLSSEEFADRFGLSRKDVGRIAAWLRDQGFHVAYTARDRDFIAFSGTAGQVRNTFHTEIHRYTIDGEPHIMNATVASVPAALADVVMGIQGLNDFRLKPEAVRAKPAETGAGGLHSLAPDDIATIYDVNRLYEEGIDGSGQSIVVVGQSNIKLADVRQFRTQYNLPGGDPQIVECCTADPGETGDANEAEADLDLEWISAVARNANIVFVYSTSADQAVFYAIDQNLAPVISESLGECEPLVAAEVGADVAAPYYEGMAKTASSKGITWVAGAGDSGAAGCDDEGVSVASQGLAVLLPSSLPEVTSVGGTEFVEGSGSYWNTTNTAHGGSALGYIPETTWNDGVVKGVLAATGGGVSTFYSKPAWQTGPGVPSGGMRDLPDVALAASYVHDAYNAYTLNLSTGTRGWYYWGGTSVSTVIMAGVVALLNQSLTAAGKPTAGNINPTLYSLAQTSPAVFHDITTGNNIVPCKTGSPDCVDGSEGYSAGVGFDRVTGLGSVDAFGLVTAWDGGLFIRSVENAEGGSAAIAPNMWLEIDGANLAPAGGILQFPGNQMPTKEDGVSVTVNGKAAYLYYLSPRQLNVLTPPDAMEGPVQVQVTNGGVVSAAFTVQAQAESPSFFVFNGGPYVAAEHANYSFIGPPSLYPGLTTPAKPGEVVLLFANGFGPTSKPIVPGSAVQGGVLSPLPVVTIGSLPATVQFAGLIGAGMYQFNVVVPLGAPDGDNSVTAAYGGFNSQPGALITVQH